jgi:hypothetical protein
MRKMPCLFQRDFTDKRRPVLLEGVTPGCEWVLNGEGVATIKRDGTACCIIGGKLHARYDAKNSKPAPVGGIPCDEPDPVTGHWPHWVPVLDQPQFKWHREAWEVTLVDGEPTLADGTYELVGPKLQSNPERFEHHSFLAHGSETVDLPVRSFAVIRETLRMLPYEGLVFWRQPGVVGGMLCKIRRADFGFAWPIAIEAGR